MTIKPWSRVPFWDRVQTGPTDECWPWLGSVQSAGYGYISGRLAHRQAYELAFGAIPDGLTIDHLCSVRLCCNPNHLEPVTREENSLRGQANRRTFRGGRWMAERTACKQGHDYTPDNTRMQGQTRICLTCQRERMERFKARRAAA